MFKYGSHENQISLKDELRHAPLNCYGTAGSAVLTRLETSRGCISIDATKPDVF